LSKGDVRDFAAPVFKKKRPLPDFGAVEITTNLNYLSTNPVNFAMGLFDFIFAFCA